MRNRNSNPYIPDPLKIALLMAFWLLLTHRFTFGNVLLAAFLAWLIPLGVNRIRTAVTPVQNALKFVSFLGLLLGGWFLEEVSYFAFFIATVYAVILGTLR